MSRVVSWLYGYKMPGDPHEHYLHVMLRVPGWVHPKERDR